MMLHKSSRFGLYAVVMMSENEGSLVSAAQIAQAFGISEDHVAKVLQQLVRARIVAGQRGVRGGYRLAVDPKRLTMLDIVEALEGPLRPACYGCDMRDGDSPTCRSPVSCAIRDVLEDIGQYAWSTLKSVTIATLATSKKPPGARSGEPPLVLCDVHRSGGPSRTPAPPRSGGRLSK